MQSWVCILLCKKTFTHVLYLSKRKKEGKLSLHYIILFRVKGLLVYVKCIHYLFTFM